MMQLLLAVFLGGCLGASCYFLGGAAENSRLAAEWQKVGDKLQEASARFKEATEMFERAKRYLEGK